MTLPTAPVAPTLKSSVDIPVFKKLEEVKHSSSITTLLYGPSKSGKTWFAGTAGSRQLYVYFQRTKGVATLKSPLFQSRFPNTEPITVEVRKFDEIIMAIEYALDKFRDEFDVVTIDEVTGLRKLAMLKGLELSSNTRRSRTQERMKNEDDFFAPGIQDYGMEMALVEWFIQRTVEVLEEQGKHVLVLAHERRTFVKKDDRSLEYVLYNVRPAFTGRTFPDDITAYFDNVFYQERVGTGSQAAHRTRLFGDDIILAGTRYAGAFKYDVIPNFSFPEMVRAIQESKKEQFVRSRS